MLGKPTDFPKAMQLVNDQICTTDVETWERLLFTAGLFIMYHFTNLFFSLIDKFLDLNITCSHTKKATCPDAQIQKT